MLVSMLASDAGVDHADNMTNADNTDNPDLTGGPL